MYEDISERRRTGDALRQSEGRLRTLMANFPMMVYSIDRDGIITMSGGKGLEAVGLAPGQVVGQSILDMYTDYPQIVASLRRALAGEQVSFMLDMGPLTFESIYTPLRDSSGEVEGMLGISTDITERRHSEELIRSQAETLQELSTPMLAIRDGVVVMPLVGAIDSRRAQQIMASVLEGVGTYRATTAIIDITGVSVVDTQVANALVRAAQAVKLLGAQAVLTGIRPEVAQTLVQLGVDLSSIITRGTLQAGIAYAIEQR
jgi:rsbT co-antagonist protein RsbR